MGTATTSTATTSSNTETPHLPHGRRPTTSGWRRSARSRRRRSRRSPPGRRHHHRGRDVVRAGRRGPSWAAVGHMIWEYAQHSGHADLLRECIDGRTNR
ncbi:DUF664 domain-containing protein [Terrabacter sp. LjRoot27]|uniref:mycothiol transferase n=1 Tax=Terrabacter sp. LjRoot27 TaxID=3342306 RepID=UPI003ECC52D5